ncbi:1,2-phenylacetyl-CoA epoxidase subunit PaaE [Oricola sp.]|uniref:1,2-phenylacetyl-CoA epoxidase subunit PaaE n=1 Tax=Oricola sp. TaxID=1979950 RepID=UPI0025F76A11|nr:1,2-phenylacetyl-CoA epoxidase subunit PaaE [Oricola sp.]MCI5076330.1 phenylacetate-CoA oxygenase/reductase subunit PaaK [Oricola sp.]
MSLQFHDLSVSTITRETPDSVCLTFDVPDGLRDAFRFHPGQHLTLRATIGGEDVRRSYSICSGLNEGRLRVGVKKVDGGLFSAFVNDRLNAGDVIQVMPPQGRFAVEVTENGANNYLMVAAGSGITPVLSMIRSILEGEPASEVTLVYGNRETSSIMFREELEDLKDRFLDRFRTVHILSRETQDVPLFNGRIDAGRLGKLASAGLIQPGEADGIFICGPGELIDEAAQALEGLGADKARIHFERFTTDGVPRRASAATREAAEKGAAVEVILDGVSKSFAYDDPSKRVVDAAAAKGIELPYSCAGGMCATCRCKIVEGSAEMDANYSLEPWETEAGYVLACQARPTSEKLVLDFDAV